MIHVYDILDYILDIIRHLPPTRDEPKHIQHEE